MEALLKEKKYLSAVKIKKYHARLTAEMLCNIYFVLHQKIRKVNRTGPHPESSLPDEAQPIKHRDVSPLANAASKQNSIRARRRVCF